MEIFPCADVENGAKFTRLRSVFGESPSVPLLINDFNIPLQSTGAFRKLNLVAFEPFRELFLLLFLPLLLWFHALQLAVPHQIDETALLGNDALHTVREVDS